MQKNLPSIVLGAVVLFGISLLYRMYSEAAFLVSMSELGGNPAFQIGRGIVPFAFYMFQGYLLWKIVGLKNWARIALAVVVLINTLLAFLFISGPFALTGLSAMVSMAQICIEVLAIILLFISRGFLRVHESSV